MASQGHRFFVAPGCFRGTQVTIAGPQAHQIARVLRLRPGDKIVVLDDSGWQAEVELTALSAEAVVGLVLRRTLVRSEPYTKLTLFQALLKGDKFEFVLQKGTELGVSGFVPMVTDRCIVANLGEADGHKFSRWQRVIREAAEQSGRGKLPMLHPVLLFPQACERVRGLALIPWEEEKGAGLRQVLREHFPPQPGSQRPFSVSVFIGPEGGFTPAEITTARSYGILPVSLGRRVLRAETAAIATAAAVLYEAGELGG